MAQGDALATRGYASDFPILGLLEYYSDPLATRGYDSSIHNTSEFLVMKLALTGKWARIDFTGKRAAIAFTGKRAKVTFTKVDC